MTELELLLTICLQKKLPQVSVRISRDARKNLTLFTLYDGLEHELLTYSVFGDCYLQEEEDLEFLTEKIYAHVVQTMRKEVTV